MAVAITAHELTHVVQQTGGKQQNSQVRRRLEPESEKESREQEISDKTSAVRSNKESFKHLLKPEQKASADNVAQGQANLVADSLGSKLSPVGSLSSVIASSKPSQNAEESHQNSKESSKNADISAVSTDAGERPKVNMTGEADPSQMHGEQAQSLQQVQAAKGQAASSISEDFGENNIFPKGSNQTLKANLDGCNCL